MKHVVVDGDLVDVQDLFILDAATGSNGLSSDDWMWHSPNGGSFAAPGSWAE
jgi:hypothetical protein